MRKRIGIVVAASAASLVLGWYLEPSITFITGALFLAFLLVSASGAEDPNPMRTSIQLHKGIPDRPLAHRAFMLVKVQKNRNPQRTFLITMLASGAVLTAIGAYWIFW